MTFGPFDITADRIEGLGPRFTEFINRLLQVEAKSHGLAGHLLTVNIKETTRDGGVDAATRDAERTDWLPVGNTAWQFKRSGLGATGCANELGGATWAHEFLRNGGSYVIAIGAALPDDHVEERRLKVAEKAIELNLIAADDRERVRVYDANAIARWASRFPSLAISQVAGGPGSVAIDFESWSGKFPYQAHWTPDPAREIATKTLRERITSAGVVEIRIQGDSGIGKTRLVLEALRDDRLSPLVAYVDDERSVGGELLEHLIEDGRRAILVVDECPAERHIKLVQKLPADPAIKLVTIGDSGAAATRTPIISVEPMPDASTDEFLKFNYQQLSSEARRFITDNGQGNMRWTIVLAERVASTPDPQAADLIARNDIEQFVTTLLPEGTDFFFATVLALFERVGWERDLRPQLGTLADFAGATIAEMESVGLALQQRGLLLQQGRYRAVAPHPLAVFLAADAWRTNGSRIITELLPNLDEGMALGLFGRVAHLGRFEPARSVLPALLSTDGPFASLEQIETTGLAKLLTPLAVVLPDEMGLHLSELIEASSVDQLRAQTASRRDLVWTLEKLVWHRRTFEVAANALLKLALAENETYGNNATGTWVELFGTMLPGTAAVPAQRVEYLAQVARDPRVDVRLRAIEGIARALVARHESIMVSGEVQGGVLVEPRGTPATYGEAGEYRRSAISLLASLLKDDDSTVARAAEDALLKAMHPLIDDAFAGEFLADVLAGLQGPGLQRLRTDAEHLLSMYDRHKQEDRQVVERLDALLARLPTPTGIEHLQVLVHLRRWDLGEGELQTRIDAAVAGLAEEVDRSSMLGLLEQELPAAWELGHALASANEFGEELLDFLLSIFDRNSSALVGYLTAKTESGTEAAFDEFLDSEQAQQLDSRARLAVAVRGPVTDRARRRILDGLRGLEVADGVAALFGWHRNLSDEEVATILDDWMARLSSQRDYNAVVDWLSLWLPSEEGIPDWMRDRAWHLISLRSEYPDLSQEGWDWGRIASGLVDERGMELARLILDLVESGSQMIHQSDDEAALLARCVVLHPEEAWDEIAQRLTSEKSWRVQMQIRGWLLHSFPSEIIERWVGDDIDRAQIVASIASPGGAEPTAVASFLLDRFGTDKQVSSGLWGEFVSGSWTGPESERNARKIEQLNGWRQRAELPLGVRTWASEMIQYLEASRQSALEREAERGF